MRKPSFLILLGLFLVLGVIALWPVVGPDQEETLPAPLDFSAFTAESVDRIVVTESGEERAIVKNGDQWQIDTFPADRTTVDALFSAFALTTANSVVSRNPENYASFGVDEPQGLTVTIEAGTGANTFTLGNAGPTINTWYGRFATDPSVYVMTGRVRDLLVRNVDGWRNRSVLTLDPDLIERITFEGDSSIAAAEQNAEGVWERALPDGTREELEDTVLDGFMQTVTALSATGFIDDPEGAGAFDAAETAVTVAIFGADNTILAELRMVQQEDESWQIRSGAAGQVFELSSFSADQLRFVTPDEG